MMMIKLLAHDARERPRVSHHRAKHHACGLLWFVRVRAGAREA
jgi:hypothetical protein